ncbi:MAG: RNA polymerase sigma factor [Candidatus Pacebacteria bacterium]|nr:RNA polymerase sigma factor [Candidatus Paceibacterota bacterium]
MARENAEKRTPTDTESAQDQETRFLKAFDEYADALFRHASYRLSDRERAIEVVHDTFTKVWGYIKNGHEIDAWKPFLYRVLNNLIIDEYRRRKELSLDAILEEEHAAEGVIDDLYEGGIDELTFSLDAQRAAALLEEVPVAYREVLVLRYVDGLGPKEISGLIEETENSVSVRIHRGLKILRTLMAQKEEQAAANRSTAT